MPEHSKTIPSSKKDEDNIELIPGQFSLSKKGTGYIHLIAPLKQTTKLRPEIEKVFTSPEPSPPSSLLDEFLHARFRALSKIYIEDYYIDFSKDDVLEKSTPLLKDQTVYTDHKVSVHNWAGVVENSLWDKESDPPGIDADIKIDIATNPKIARGLSIQPPAIHSASVTAFFLWSKSHPDMDDNEFFYNLGKEKKGEIVRVIVDEITQYGEFSLVWQGADPNAKRKFQANLNKIRMNPLESAESISATGGKGGNQMDQKEQIQELQDQIMSLEKEKDEAIKIKQDLEKEITSLTQDAELGKKYCEELIAQTESLYRLLKADAVDDDFIDKMIKNAPVENLQILKKDYETALADKLFFTCPYCGKSIKNIRASKEPAKEAKKPNEKQAEQHKV